MADTRPDVVVPAKTWVNLYTASGITVGTAVSVYNKGSNSTNIVMKATQPTDTTLGVPLYVGPIGNYAAVPSGASGLWAYSETGTRLLVQE